VLQILFSRRRGELEPQSFALQTRFLSFLETYNDCIESTGLSHVRVGLISMYVAYCCLSSWLSLVSADANQFISLAGLAVYL